MGIETALLGATLGAKAGSAAMAYMGSQVAAAGAQSVAGLQAHAARYQGAVDANRALIESENAARTAEARAEADEFNATVAAQMAEGEVEKAGAEANDFRRAQSARLASARARQAGSGIALEGSPLMVDEAIFSEIEFGAQRMVHAGGVSATRLRNQAGLLRATSALDRVTAKNLREAGRQTADWAVEGADISARSALHAGSVKAGASRLEGYGRLFSSFGDIGSTLLGRGRGGFGSVGMTAPAGYW